MAFASWTYPRNVVLFLALLIVAAVLTSSSSLAASADDSNSTYGGLSGRYCFGSSVGECQDDEVEWLMESGTSRSLLVGGGKLSKGALNPDQPAPGKVPRGQPYTGRGCNGPIYRCKS